MSHAQWKLVDGGVFSGGNPLHALFVDGLLAASYRVVSGYNHAVVHAFCGDTGTYEKPKDQVTIDEARARQWCLDEAGVTEADQEDPALTPTAASEDQMPGSSDVPRAFRDQFGES